MLTTAEREDMRETILDAAKRLLDRFGYRKTTMDDLAREAGIGKGTIYLYFRSKEDVALSVGERMHRRLCAELEAIAARDVPAPARIEQMLRTRVMFMYDQFESALRTIDELFRDIWHVVMARREPYDAAEAAILERVIRAGIERDELVCDAPALASQALVWASNSQMPYHLTPKQSRDRDAVAARIDAVSAILVAGLRRGC